MDEEMVDKIAEKAVEKILKRMPDVIGNLMMNHAMINKLNREFYSKYPEFAHNKDLVASVIEQVEGKDLTQSYESILEKSVPMIKERLKTVEGLSLKTEPYKHNPRLTVDIDSNGVL